MAEDHSVVLSHQEKPIFDNKNPKHRDEEMSNLVKTISKKMELTEFEL